MSQLDTLFFDDDTDSDDDTALHGGRKRALGDGQEKDMRARKDGKGDGGGPLDNPNGDGDDVQLKVDDDVELKKKARKKLRPFNEDILTSRDGLTRIYEEFPNSCKFRGRGKEAEDLKALLSMYKEWGFQLYPNLALPDLLARCDTLGAKGRVRGQMEQLRDRERSRYLSEELRVPLAEIRVRILADVNQHQQRGSPEDVTSPETSSPSGRDFGDLGGDLLASPVPGNRLHAPPEALWNDDMWDENMMANIEKIERQALEAAAEKENVTVTEEAGLFDFENEDEDIAMLGTAKVGPSDERHAIAAADSSSTMPLGEVGSLEPETSMTGAGGDAAADDDDNNVDADSAGAAKILAAEEEAEEGTVDLQDSDEKEI